MPRKPIRFSELRRLAANIVGGRLALDLCAAADLRRRVSCGPNGWEPAN
jgi:hypothetical protein